MGAKKLSFADALADEVEASKPGRPTAIDTRVLEVVDAATRDEIVSALQNKALSHGVISRTLRRLGFDISSAAIRNYRLRQYPGVF
jgi:hypothetical protein